MPIEGNQTRPGPVFAQPPMQRTVNGPLNRGSLVAAKQAEQLRREWDEFYITQAEAAAIPQEALTQELISRIKYSQRDWPENRMTLKDAMGPLQPGEGELPFNEGSVPSRELFWEPAPGAPPPEHQLRGRRGLDRGER